MKKELGRRDLLGRAGIALGGALTFGALQACGGDDSADPQPAAQPLVSDFPYEKHLPASYLDAGGFDVATVKQAAYEAYFAGGCCHGAYSALLADLQRAGAPFTDLPLTYGKFGGGGIDGYGSVCGAALGAVLVMNMLVEDRPIPDTSPVRYTTHRKNLVTELLRWYERFAFPQYQPTANVDPAGKTRKFVGDADPAGGPLPAVIAVVPGSHLCHASVSGWCHANGDLDANGSDKKARCARLTADVAGKAAALLNAYLENAYGARTAGAPAAFQDNCMDCHNNSQPTPTVDPVVASGMECRTCHTTHTVTNVPESCLDCHTDGVIDPEFPPTTAH